MTHWYVLVVLALTAYRVTRLIVKDDFPPILWVRDRLVGGWRRPTTAEWERFRAEAKATLAVTPLKPQQRRSVRLHQADVGDGKGESSAVWNDRKPWVPGWLAELLGCPWCVSAYVSGALTALTDVTVGVPAPWLTAGAVWAVAAVLASRQSL